MDLSIVLPTCNRATLLERSLAALWTYVNCDYEVIVVDGASDDATPLVLADAGRWMKRRLRVIREDRREGFVRAVNKGFRAARGRNVMWLNDDARPLPGALDNAVQQLDDAPAGVGLVAMYHHVDVERNIAHEAMRRGRPYRLLHVRGTLYANFGMGRRDTFARLGYFDERYFLNAADPDFSLKVWHAGLRVVPSDDAFIDHDEHADERRAQDSVRGRQDNERLFAKWDLPPKNAAINDYDPARPCTLRGLRDVTAPKAA